MSEATIRAQIKAELESVSNIGLVHDYDRLTTTWDELLARFKTTISGSDQIRAWTIQWSGFEPGDPQAMGGAFVRFHRFVIRGYLGLDDSAATEKTFSALVEDVCDELDGSATLHSLATYFDTFWTSVPVCEARMFGGTLCHYAEIVLIVGERMDV